MNRGAISALLRRYGQPITLRRADGSCVEDYAFVQPIRSTDTLQNLPTPLGIRREDRFLYLGSGSLPVKAGEGQVRCGGIRYDVVQAQPIYIGDAVSHWWAVLVPGEEEV